MVAKYFSVLALSFGGVFGTIFGVFFGYLGLTSDNFVLFLLSIFLFLIGISSLAYLFYEK